MDLNLRDHVAVVLGAASGIGLAIAKQFQIEGAKVVLLDRDEQVLKRASDLESSNTLGLVCDVTQFEQVQRQAAVIAERLGPARHVIFAVGAGSGKFGYPFWNLTPSDWPRVIEVNLV